MSDEWSDKDAPTFVETHHSSLITHHWSEAMEGPTTGARMKLATACAGLTLAGNLLLFMMRRLEAVEVDRQQFQVAVEHRLTAIETKLDLLLGRKTSSR
jgi:hypothetical protein